MIGFSTRVSFRWRDMADTIARPENRPWMMHFEGHNLRIVRPAETLPLEREIFMEALFSKKTNLWVRLVKMYLIHQNGEACVSCSLVCTEGMVELSRRYADTAELKSILRHCSEGIDGDFGIGSQHLSGMQGGSDVPSNLLEAVPDDGFYRLYATSFFCSAAHAYYCVVTANPVGSEKVGLLIVPSWLPGAGNGGALPFMGSLLPAPLSRVQEPGGTGGRAPVRP